MALYFSRGPGATAAGQTRTTASGSSWWRGEWLVNPGSVGQPRDGDPRAAWLELDEQSGGRALRRTDYDIAGAAAAIRAAQLPDSLAERLRYRTVTPNRS